MGSLRQAIDRTVPARPVSPGPARLLDFLDWNRDHVKSIESGVVALTRTAEQDRHVIGKLVDDLLEASKKLLLQPFAKLAAPFPKLVRDLCRDLGKEADLVIRGEEIDKRVLEEMRDPLTHLLRNCVDHGVFFNGRKHFITADRLQILNLLLATYEAAIERNRELSRARDELRQLNIKLEVANKKLESFSYSVSHDLGAPLRHIDGFVGLLGASMAGKLNTDEQGRLATIAESTKRMGRLIDDLLGFSRMERAEMRGTAVDLNGTLRDVILGMEPETKGRKIVWKIDLLPSLQADQAMIRQVFANLLSNAVKYTRARGTTEITVGVCDAPPYIILSVRDNGVGFDMRQADKLFGVFQRLHRADEFEGTGIGLANVRRIVARHGGRTWAEGKEGEGATFYFSLLKS